MINKMQIFTTKYLAIGITVLLASLVFSQRNAHASDYPIFRDGKLIIPRVDTDAQPGTRNFSLKLPQIAGNSIDLSKLKLFPVLQPMMKKLKPSL